MTPVPTTSPTWRQIADAGGAIGQPPVRLAISILIPLAASAMQWALWPWVKPFVWLLFYPAVFLSARIGGLRGALPAAILSMLLVWYLFAEPQLAWGMKDPTFVWSMVLFFLMSLLFGDAQELTLRAYRRLERAMEQNRISYTATLDAILQTSHHAILIVNGDGRIIEVNAQAERMFGYAPSAMAGMSVETLVPEKLRPQHFRDRSAFAAAPGHRMARSRDVFARRSDGGEFLAEVVLGPISLQGSPLVVVTVADITDRVRAETEVRRLNASLEQRVAERTAELQTSNRELEAFSYSISHDLRAPLRAIDGFSRILEHDYAARLDENGQDYLTRIRRSAKRMGELIDDLLNLARIGKVDLKRTEVDLSAEAGAVADALRTASPEREAQFDIAQGMTARGDARLLRIVLENLLSNAWKFTARRAPARIEFGQKEIDGRTAFYVSDNGAGFDMAYADKLFGAFQRLHDVRDFPGNGVGLAIVHRIIGRHGGRIWAQAKPEKGAAFYFTLEASAPAAAAGNVG